MHSVSKSTFVLGLLAAVCVQSGLAIPVVNPRGLEARGPGDNSPPPSPQLKAADLKTSNYRGKAPASGSYVAQGESAKWQQGAKGDAEHVVEPGQHVVPALKDAGLGKKDPVTQAVKAELNKPDNLSKLQNAPNIAKAKLAADAGAHPKNEGPAKDYMAKPDVQDKAKVTTDAIKKVTADKGHPGVGLKIETNVAKNFPNVKGSPSSPKSPNKRELYEWLLRRSLENFLDEMD